jgi:tetratricopeptide (TPR) repeat protein
MFELKQLTLEAVPAALEKAVRYRLLNEPGEAESICLDVLAIDPDNQKALVVLLLAMSDRFGRGFAVSTTKVRDILGRLTDAYERHYYAGILSERSGKCQLAQVTAGSGYAAYELLREAMDLYEQAEKIRPAGNDDALLRWNACARLIMGNKLSARAPERYEPALE